MKFSSLTSPLLHLSFLWSVTILRAERLRGADGRGNSNDRRRAAALDEYIVVLQNQPMAGADVSVDANAASIRAQVEQAISSSGGTVLQTYSSAINAYTAMLPAEVVAALAADPNVAYIEPNALFSINAVQTQKLPWGLDRIDQATGLDGRYTYDATGAGVEAYIIDTGIRSTHSEFTGRLGVGYNVVQQASSPHPWDDCDGHGTHVASTVGGTNYGVAKSVTLHAVRVLDCSGSGYTSDILTGIDWVIAQHKSAPGKKSVVNMSLGGSKSSSLNQAVQNMAAAGIVVAVAAGNENVDACTTSPASATNILSVGATTNADVRASFSNYGSCVQIFAPGAGILGAWYNCDTCTNTISGTSMASPHVAGVAALYLEKIGGTAAQIRSAILTNAGNNVVTSAQTNPNKFLQSKTSGQTPTAPTPAPAPAPVSAPTAPAPKCRAKGSSCTTFLCSAFSSCCCAGLKCKSLLGVCG